MTTPSQVTVRPLAPDADLGRLNRGNALGWIADWWRGMTPDPGLPILWWEAVVDGRGVGFAALARGALSAGGYGNALVHVLDGARRRGAGAALRAAVEGEARGHLPGVVYFHGDEDADAAAAVAAWGLSVSERHSESVLDLTALDRAELERLAARAEVDLVPLGEPDTVTDGEWHALYDFFRARFQETPDAADGGGDITFAFFREAVSDRRCLVRAEDAGELVGITVAMSRPGDDRARNTLLTGVSPAARGRGVALALKARHALVLADGGSERLYTQNMVGNEPILAANRRLGFVRDSGYCEVPVALA